MPLIDLKTELKDLKFGTLAPYIVKDINNPPVYNSLSNEVSRRTDDVSRLTKMFLDRPGAIFLAKQAALQATDRTNYAQRNPNLLTGIATALFRGTISVGQTGLTILGQAAVEGTGTRLVGKLPPFYYSKALEAGGSQTVFGTEVTPRDGFRTVFSTRTSEFRYLSSQQLATSQGSTSRSSAASVTETSRIERSKQGIQSEGSAPATEAGNLAQQGKTINIVKYKSAITGKQEDSIDKKFGFAATRQQDNVNLFDIGAGEEKDDLVPLMFGKFDPTSEKLYTDLKLFRGFVGDIADNFQANWSNQSYVGRMEQFFVYTGFSRTITFPFTIPIFSELEQPTVYNKVNALVSHTAPEYRPQGGIPSGVITYLKVGDYLQTPGVLTSVGVSITNDVPWSYGPTLFASKPLLLPQVIKLQIQFTPIHELAPTYRNSTLAQLADRGEKFQYIGNTRAFETEDYRNRVRQQRLQRQQELTDNLLAQGQEESLESQLGFNPSDFNLG